MTDPEITTARKEYLKAGSDLLSTAFKTNSTITYFLSSLPPSKRDLVRPKFFHSMLLAATLNRATISEVNNWESCGVLVPPGSRVDNYASLLPAAGKLLPEMWNLGAAGCKRLFVTFPSLTGASKHKIFPKGDEKYYYIFFLGTLEEGRGKGLCSALVKHYQSIAAKGNLPIYLEAADDYCWGVYKKLGFVTLGEIRVGKGKHDADGYLCDGGEGFVIRPMIWKPQ